MVNRCGNIVSGSGDNLNRTGKSVYRGGNIAKGRGYTVNGE